MAPFVFIVDGDPAFRDRARMVLQSAAMDSVGFASAEEFLSVFVPRHPACVLTELRLPGQSGLDLFRRLRAIGATLPMVMVSGHGDIATAVQAVRAGILDFIEKPCDDQRLLSSVHEAIQRDEALSATEQVRHRVQSLTDREKEVMDLLVAGQMNKTVGTRLGISERTVEVHKAKVMAKMEAKTLAELIRMAVTLERPM